MANQDGVRRNDDRDNLTASYAEMNRLRIEEKKNQLNTEFQRYKQDCRKRALDLAHTEYPDRKKDKPDILKNADEYYNWLISIPEK
jgi:hypothetical protein